MIRLTASTIEKTPQEMASLIEQTFAVAEDVGPALPSVVARFHVQMKRRFTQEGAGGPEGPWAELSASYKAWKSKRYPDAPILRLTGALEESLTAQGRMAIVEYGPNQVFIGSNVPYGEFHQDGTGKMPRRPPIDPSDKDVAEWTVEIWRSFNQRTSRLGWRGRFAGAMA